MKKGNFTKRHIPFIVEFHLIILFPVWQIWKLIIVFSSTVQNVTLTILIISAMLFAITAAESPEKVYPHPSVTPQILFSKISPIKTFYSRKESLVMRYVDQQK